MIRTQIYLPDELHQELKLVAQKEGVNFSTLIRQGAREIIKKKKIKKTKTWGLGIVGAVKLKEKTNSVEVVKDYYRNFGK